MICEGKELNKSIFDKDKEGNIIVTPETIYMLNGQRVENKMTGKTGTIKGELIIIDCTSGFPNECIDFIKIWENHPYSRGLWIVK